MWPRELHSGVVSILPTIIEEDEDELYVYHNPNNRCEAP